MEAIKGEMAAVKELASAIHDLQQQVSKIPSPMEIAALVPVPECHCRDDDFDPKPPEAFMDYGPR